MDAADATSAVLVSGGLDSAVALGLQVAHHRPVEALHVDYGQPARFEESEASAAIATHFGAPYRRLSMSGFKVPSGEIRGRNALLVFAALTAAPSARTIVIGTHPGSPYWDCSDGFLTAMQMVLDGYSGGATQLLAPFAGIGKSGIHALAEELDMPLELIYSCEQAAGPCGDCQSCLDVEVHAR